MDDREFECKLRRLFKLDFSVGREAFRDGLLARCLEVLSLRSNKGTSCDVRDINDADLDMLAAAGDIAILENKPFPDEDEPLSP